MVITAPRPARLKLWSSQSAGSGTQFGSFTSSSLPVSTSLTQSCWIVRVRFISNPSFCILQCKFIVTLPAPLPVSRTPPWKPASLSPSSCTSSRLFKVQLLFSSTSLTSSFARFTCSLRTLTFLQYFVPALSWFSWSNSRCKPDHLIRCHHSCLTRTEEPNFWLLSIQVLSKLRHSIWHPNHKFH